MFVWDCGHWTWKAKDGKRMSFSEGFCVYFVLQASPMTQFTGGMPSASKIQGPTWSRSHDRMVLMLFISSPMWAYPNRTLQADSILDDRSCAGSRPATSYVSTRKKLFGSNGPINPMVQTATSKGISAWKKPLGAVVTTDGICAGTTEGSA